jgi:tRNA threonylcarbamoyladenosine biosynthesis protein TsaE
MNAFGRQLGQQLAGGAVIELVGDVGAGKTTLTKAIGAGLGVDDDIQSPSFTISRTYELPDGRVLAHYDFYRLHDAGIMTHELHDSVNDPKTITIIEWADIVTDVLPEDRLQIVITPASETARQLAVKATGPMHEKLVERL